MIGLLGFISFLSGIYFTYVWFGWWGYVGVFLAAWVITLFIPKSINEKE